MAFHARTTYTSIADCQPKAGGESGKRMGTVSDIADILRSDNPSFLFKALMRQYPIAAMLSKLRHAYYRFQYGDAVPAPYRLVDIDPERVTHVRVPRFSYTLSTGRAGSHIVDGEWDRRYIDDAITTPVLQSPPEDGPGLARLEDFVVYEACKQRFEQGADWDETEMVDAIERQDVETYPSDIDELYARIDQQGYRTQRELSIEGKVHNRVSYSRFPPEFDEVLVDIGRGGEVILDEGKHRFTVARLLGIESIPCRVFVRHKEWQEKRQQVSEATSVEDLPEQLQTLLEHPDMADVRPALKNDVFSEIQSE